MPTSGLLAIGTARVGVAGDLIQTLPADAKLGRVS